MCGQKTYKILVVDDNRENCELARATLEEEGYTVVLARSGQEGLLSFEQESPDCVLLDVRMPDLDGFKVCARIRALPGGADVPVVFLTALRDVDTFDQAIRAGGDDFLTKPVRPTELLVRVQAALKLRRMSTELREHYDIVRHQRDDLMRLQLQKERLAAFIVHDLKNPVAVVDLHAQLLLSEAEQPERVRDGAQQIRSSVRALMRLILNLLDVSKGEEGQLVPRPTSVDLMQLVNEVADVAAVSARASTVSLEIDVPKLMVHADPDLLRRVFENLVDNALRHAPAAGRIVLSAAVREGEICISVADNGVGVASENRERIFDPFVQAECADKASRSGRGLGLTFCKFAVEAHGGRIWVEDANPGARFCFVLPHTH